MDPVFSIILGAVQGIAEFLPISSSGHLVVFQQLFGSYFQSADVSLAFDVFVHIATLLVALWYLRADILLILYNIFSPEESKDSKRAKSLFVLVSIATIPAVIVALSLDDLIEQSFSSLAVCAFGFLITSAVLTISDYKGAKTASAKQEPIDASNWSLPSYAQALLIGIAQAFAICPGISRSGSTIAVALMLGLPPRTAIKFSFLMFIPAVVGAGLKELPELLHLSASDFLPYALGFATAAFVGSIAIRLLELLVLKSRLKYFAIYTFSLSLFLAISLF